MVDIIIIAASVEIETCKNVYSHVLQRDIRSPIVHLKLTSLNLNINMNDDYDDETENSALVGILFNIFMSC